MGLLDRWTKKQQTAKLKKLDKNEDKKEKSVEKVKKAEKTEVAPVAAASKEVKAGGIAYKILVRPLVTEKAAVMESHNKYSFVVAHYATKIQIKQAIVEAYGVRPTAVNIFNVEGKRVRFGRTMGRRGDYRKAVVTLPAGQTISLHEGV